MISPEASVDINPLDIKIGERQRKDLSNPSYLLKIDELKASMKNHGLIHPIVVQRDLKLVAGFTRLNCAIQLGWKTIPARFVDECDDLTLREIELEENLARSDLVWLDVVMARSSLHKLKLQLYGQADHTRNDFQIPNAPELNGWSVQKTADSLGITKRQVQIDLAIASAVEIKPEIAEADSKPIALKMITRLCEDLEFNIRLLDANQAKLTEINSSLWLGDCINEMAKIPTDSVNLIITDPPYGIDYDSIGGSGYRTKVEFDDSPEAVLAILRSALREMRRVLRSDGHLYGFFGIQLWSETLALYRAMGFDPDPLPLVWVKNTGGTVDWDHRYNPVWEPIVFCRSERRLDHKRDNVFSFSTPAGEERLHASQKPVGLLREFINASSQPNELVLDPFAGSGSTLIAAKELNRRWIGIEKQQRMYDIARMRLLR